MPSAELMPRKLQIKFDPLPGQEIALMNGSSQEEDMNNTRRRLTASLLITSSAAVAIALAVYLLLPPPQPASAGTPGTMSFTYDSLGRVITDANSTGNSGAYTYDASGNRTSASLN